jgi:hypothetical protein
VIRIAATGPDAINLQLRSFALSHIIAAGLEFSDGFRADRSAYSKTTAGRAAVERREWKRQRGR